MSKLIGTVNSVNHPEVEVTTYSGGSSGSCLQVSQIRHTKAPPNFQILQMDRQQIQDMVILMNRWLEHN